MEYAYYTYSRGVNGIHRNTVVFHLPRRVVTFIRYISVTNHVALKISYENTDSRITLTQIQTQTMSDISRLGLAQTATGPKRVRAACDQDTFRASQLKLTTMVVKAAPMQKKPKPTLRYLYDMY